MPATGTAGAFLSRGDRNCVCSMPLLTLRADCGGTRNVVLTGASTHCHVPRFADPISIKAVCYGGMATR
jgi:hypothetical protein